MDFTRRGMGAMALASLTALGTRANAAEPRVWGSAIDDIRARIAGIHPKPFFDSSADAFAAQARDLRRALPRLSDETAMARAMQLVATINDGHTQLEPLGPAFRHWYGVRLYHFTDGYFVTSAYGPDADLAGAEILEIAGRPAGASARCGKSMRCARAR